MPNGLTVKFDPRGRTYTQKDFRGMSDHDLISKVCVFADYLPWKNDVNRSDLFASLCIVSKIIREREEEAKVPKTIREAIHTQQKVTETEKALDAAEAEAATAYEAMVDDKDLNGLQEIAAILEDLKGSFNGSSAFEDILQAVKDRIKDEQMVLKRKAA